MPLLYHVSTDLSHTGQFTPRIPLYRYHVENNSIPRVAAAPSLAKCLTSLPSGGADLDILLEETMGFVKVFAIDTDALSIADQRIIAPDMLFSNGLVGDAQHTLEHWLLDPFTVPIQNQHIVYINNWDVQNIDIVPQFIQDIGDRYYEGEWHNAYNAVFKEDVPCSTEIVNVDYQTTRLETGESLDLYHMDDQDESFVQVYIDQHNAPLKLEGIMFTATDDVNIAPLVNALYHYRHPKGDKINENDHAQSQGPLHI